MSFGFALAAAFFLVSLGGAVGCLVCMLCGTVFHKPVLKGRLTVCCLFLSVSIATVAVVLIFSPVFITSFLSIVRQYAVFLAILFGLGFFCAALQKTVLPVVVICYITAAVFTGVKLYGAFGAQAQTGVLTVSVGATVIKVDGKEFLVDSPAGKNLVFKVYALPDTLLLPLPHLWYVFEGVDSSADTELVFSGEESPSLFGSGLRLYRTWLLKNVHYQRIAVPDPVVYPSLYTIQLTPVGDALQASVMRHL